MLLISQIRKKRFSHGVILSTVHYLLFNTYISLGYKQNAEGAMMCHVAATSHVTEGGHVPVLANPLAMALAFVGSHLRHVISISINIIGSSRSCFQPKKALLYMMSQLVPEGMIAWVCVAVCDFLSSS
jgi:hypothetical protein